MTAITYTAKRDISSGHVVDTSYSLETLGEELTPAFDPDVVQSFTLDGTPETVFNHIKKTWKVKTSVIDQSDYDVWVEFLSSVAGGEALVFDAYGTIVSPDNVQTAILLGSPRLSRVATLTKWNISFTVRIIS